MKIKTFKFLEGAAKAEGLTVIIDVFRAYTTAAYLFANQAEKIFIVSKVETARKLKEELNNPVLIGERKGIKIEDFDFNNSPYFISQHNFVGKEIILSTSAGTKGIIAAKNAAEIITGSFVNIAAAAEYIKNKKPEIVSLVAMGNNGVAEADEDNLYAEQLVNLLKGKKTLTRAEIKARLRSPAGDRFFADCLKLTKFDFVIRAEQTDSDIYQLIRKEVD